MPAPDLGSRSRHVRFKWSSTVSRGIFDIRRAAMNGPHTCDMDPTTPRHRRLVIECTQLIARAQCRLYIYTFVYAVLLVPLHTVTEYYRYSP